MKNLFCIALMILSFQFYLTAENSGFPSINLTKSSFQINEPITITVSNGNNPSHKMDWVGLYEADITPNGKPPSIWFVYLPDQGITNGNGQIGFDPSKIPEKFKDRYSVGKKYKFIFAFDDSYKIQASVNFTVNKNNEKIITSYKTFTEKTKAGFKPVLPVKVTLIYNDNSTTEKEIKWNDIDPSLYASAGSFTVKGFSSESGIPVKVNVTVIEGSGPLLHFNVISDIHIKEDDSSGSNVNFKKALKDIEEADFESDALCFAGDFTDNGSEVQYNNFYKIINSAKHPPIYPVIGNHEIRWRNGGYSEAQKRFLDKTGMPAIYYDKWIKGYHFIFLASEKDLKDMAYLSPDQLKWLETKLSEKSDISKPVFVFLHQPLKDTVPLTSASDGYTEKDPTDGVVQDKELKEIFSKYPQTIFFTGHTHMNLTSSNEVYRSNICTMVNTASVSYLWNGPSGGSQGLFIDVYNDKVLIKGRDFTNKEWIPKAQFIVNYSKNGPLPVPESYILSNKLIYEIGEDIAVEFYNGPGNTLDWIGLYNDGAPDSPSIDWQYVDGSKKSEAGIKTGILIFKGGLSKPGNYNVRFFADGGYERICKDIVVTIK